MKGEVFRTTPSIATPSIATPSITTPLIATLLLFHLPGVLFAHHILGIPHYKYSEDYPQIPYLEVLAQVGDHDLVFTHFPGFPKPGETVRLKLYVHDRKTGDVFRQPLPVEVVKKHFLSAAESVAEPFEILTGTGPEKNDFKFYLTFPAAEAYEVRVKFPTTGGIETIPFPVTIGKTDDRPLIFGAVGLLGLTVVSVALIKKRRRVPKKRLRRD